MKVYLDTGFFIDYLSSRGPIGSYLRKATRQGRQLIDLANDAEKCLDLIETHHEGMTSSLTFYEVEEAFYKELSRSISNITHGKRYLIFTARSVVPQLIMATELYKIKVLDVSGLTIRQQAENLDLQLNSIRAADALHITTAIANNVDILITTDSGILNLDNKIVNKAGHTIRCVDSDTGKGLLMDKPEFA